MANLPQFSLETNDKAITANLAVIGRPGDEARKAVIHVTSKSGEVRVDMQEKTIGRFFDLDIYNKEGVLTSHTALHDLTLTTFLG